MKIAVYSIAKNEENFVERWYNSAKDADYLFILDTGSSDNTVQIAENLGINVQSRVIVPWRFDTARNVALNFLPLDIDYCIALDMDEVLVPGWRDHIEKLDNNLITRPRYKYTWSWKEDGSPGLQYAGDKIHSRLWYYWKHPVHEVIFCVGTETQGWCDLEIHHFPDHTKSRGQYFPLLELAVKEDPTDDRNSHYLAREYFFNKMYDEAAKEFKRHLSLEKSQWKPERAASMRYLSKCEPENREKWLWDSVEEASERREGWVELAKYYYEEQKWMRCYYCALAALKIKEKPLDYICDEFAWGPAADDYAAISSYNLGFIYYAIYHGKKAVDMNPDDPRLNSNLSFYISALENIS